MWSIFNDYYIKAEISKLKPKVRENMFSTNELPKFVFICGESLINEDGTLKSHEELKLNQNRRQYLVDLLNSYTTQIGSKNEFNNIICLIAEKLYKVNDKIDILTFEELLAELSDDIILLVESYGTVCELGAFSYDGSIAKKLFVINKSEHETAISFINEGPVKKIKNYNEENVIYVDKDFNSFKRDFRLESYLKKVRETSIGIKPNLINKLLV